MSAGAPVRDETMRCLTCGDTEDTVPGKLTAIVLAERCEVAGHSCRPVVGPKGGGRGRPDSC